MLRNLHGKEGMALVLVLVFTAALMILGTALISFALNEILIADYNNRDIRLYYLVEGGAEIGIAVLKEDFYYEQDISGSMSGGTFIVSFSDEYQHFHDQKEDEEGEDYYENNDQIRFVRCIGTLKDFSKTLSIALIITEDNQVIIKNWYKAFPKHL